MQSAAQPHTSQRRQGSTPEASVNANMEHSQQGQVGQGPQVRSASGSAARVHPSRSSNPDKQISQIEKSVTHLLVATKQLLETLTQWSRGNAQEEEVSDVYVRLGYEFNLACRAFNSIGVDTADLGPVPDLLRTILEDTLSQSASPQALDNYLPRIRDIIINLLQGLKRKQSKLRTKPTKGGPSGLSQGSSRQMSTASATSNDSSLTAMVEDATAQQESARSERGRTDSPGGLDNATTESGAPQFNNARSSLRRSIRRDAQTIPSSDSSSTISSTTAQSLPVLPPSSHSDTSSIVAGFPHAPPPPPPPPPPTQDALAKLQKGGDLERRASRRFSAYQISKHLGASPNGVPVIPPAQNSPIPNRGREVRESMRAVTSRTSYQPGRQKSTSTKLNDASPSRSGTSKAPQRISEERDEPPSLNTKNIPQIEPPAEENQDDSPTAKTPEEYRKKPQIQTATSPGPQLGATVNGPFSPSKESDYFGVVDGQAQHDAAARSPTREAGTDGAAKSSHHHVTTAPESRASATPPPTTAVDLDSSPASSKELTLFLQYKSRIKKFVLSGGYEDLTLARLQLAFIEKFAWSTHNNSTELPEIYIQDPVSGVRHELEDLNDVKDRSVLVLNFEVLDEVKKHFDEGIGGLRSTLEGVRSLLDGQGTMMQRFSDRQLEASKEVARLAAAPTPRATRPAIDFPTNGTAPISGPVSEASLAEVQTLRRDIAVLRQTYASMSSDFAAAMKDIKSKAANVKSAAETAALPSYEGNAGRAHVNEGKKTLNTESEALVNRVDNLSDTVEDLRKDVVSRGVRPRARDLELLSKEISATSKALSHMKEFLKHEKPIWTKIWEAELNLVCTERDDLTQQEELMSDLHGDLEDVQNVFNLVEEAMKQQNLSGGTGSLRSVTSKPLPLPLEIDPSADPTQVKEGVLDEVRALRPNHEDRLEAIERAEKLRRKELEGRLASEFQREVESFVEEGKLRRTGGMDEVERVRMAKDQRAFKENWETQRALEAEKARKKAEREAKKVAAAAQAQADANGDVALSQHTQEASQVEGTPDFCQEPGTPFQDAPTGMTPQPTPAIEVDDPTQAQFQQSVNSASRTTSPNQSKDKERISGGPSRLPEVLIGDGSLKDHGV